jgi:hypothetical protein
MGRFENGNRLILALASSLMTAVPIVTLRPTATFAVDAIASKDAPNLTAVRAQN